MSKTNIRNIAIIAHVDHGKTTLVDALFRQSGIFRANQNVAERVMDSNELEKERGITILAKCTSVTWKDYTINIVDTPGHADFGAEVERILSMVDGVVLLVDSAEGAMPQTKFVTSKALSLGLRPIVVVNKIDRSDSRGDEVVDEVFDLFVALEANDEQLEFPVMYASGREGWANNDIDTRGGDLAPLFEKIIAHVPPPSVNVDAPFRMLATTIESDSFLGRILTGKVSEGRVKIGMQAKALNINGELVEQARITKIMKFKGVEKIFVDEAEAGDIIAVAGFEKATVSDTLCDPVVTEAIKSRPIDPPTISMLFAVNDSPLAGREGTKVTSRMIKDRLEKEAESNVAIKVVATENGDAFEVSGRGELQMGVLIETMRREGFELSISRPRVITKKDEQTGETLEPYEEVVVDVDEEFSGAVVQSISERKGTLQEMRSGGSGKQRLIFIAPSRGLIGYHGQFLTETRGTGVMSRVFHSFGEWKGTLPGRRNGVLISNGGGKAVAYALWNLEARGEMFIEHNTEVYEGMIVGEHNRDNDLDVNVLKGKQLTNVRASGTDEAVRLTPPRKLSLEQCIAYIDEDELVEVTPKNVRMRKMFLSPNDRKRNKKAV